MSEPPSKKGRMADKPGVPYETLRDKMRTFDLLLFRGTDAVSGAISRVERAKTGCGDYTHVGILVRGSDLMPIHEAEGEDKWLKPETLYVFESTMSGEMADGCPDVHGESHLGVQLRALDDVVAAYDKPAKSRLAWCAVLQGKLPATLADDAERAKACRAAYEKYRGLRYDLSAVDLAACAFPAMRRIRDSKAFSRVRDALSRVVYGSKRADGAEGGDNDLISKWQFCSELAANIYKDIGAIPATVEPQNVMPVDFLTKDEAAGSTYDADKQVPVLFAQPERFYA
jgi:hypothetical protein